jgi:AraC-like DNA-binding protein
LYRSQFYNQPAIKDIENVQIWTSAPPLRLITSSPHHRTEYTRRHHHPFYELGLVLGGRCTWLLGTRGRLRLHSGEALLLKPRAVHCEQIEPAEEARLAWLGFDLEGPAPEWCQRAIPLGEDVSEIAVYFDAIAAEHHLTDPRSRARTGLALQSLLLLLERRAEGSRHAVSIQSGLNPRQVHTVESAAHYFRNNLQKPLSIAQVAAYHSLCPAHFSSLFRRYHRITPRRFLHQTRVQRAADWLAESVLSLKEVAARCGFVDAAHLCKAFRKDRRTTPGLFRAKMRDRKPGPR